MSTEKHAKMRELIEGASNLVIYHHFKGNYYIVLQVAYEESSGEPVVVYKSLADGTVWTRPLSSFIELLPEGIDNPTGQKYRFEKIKDLRRPLSYVPTEVLVEEFKSRGDNPYDFALLDEAKERVWRDRYLVGQFEDVYFTSTETHQDFITERSFDTLQEAEDYVTISGNPRMKILRNLHSFAGF